MTPTEAAKRWLELKPQIAPLAKELEACEKVLKVKLADGGTFRGVHCTVTSFEQLDGEAAKALLGKRAPMKPVTRRSLSPAK